MKRTLFIGSSKEGLKIAKKLEKSINTCCDSWLKVKIWQEPNLFKQNRSTLQNLINFSRRFDYGIFIATADDLTYKVKRDELKKSMRDNVLFETGLFLGSLGLDRSILLVEKDCSLPSDYAGTSIFVYNSNQRSSLKNKINEIITTLENSQNNYNISIIPSTALAVGYYENYIKAIAEEKLKRKCVDYQIKILIPTKVSDINNRILKHQTLTNSTEIKIFEDKERPTFYSSNSGLQWDIPSTLKTLGFIIDKLAPSEFIGIDAEKEEWLSREINNFKNTLEYLISRDCACKEHFAVEFLGD